MKYTIEGFNQEEVIKLRNLDVIDLVILRWIVDFEPNMTKKEINGETYFWVNYQSLLEALPILNIQKLALYRRLEKMCNSNILKHKNVKDNGNYSYYTFGKEYKKLISSKIEDISSTIEPSILEDRNLISSTIEQNNSSIKEIHLLNNSIICGNMEKKKKFIKPTIDEIKSYCQERNNNIDAEKFIDYYESNGWKVGRNSMKDWKACIRTWEKNNEQKLTNMKSYKSTYERSQEALKKARKALEDE